MRLAFGARDSTGFTTGDVRGKTKIVAARRWTVFEIVRREERASALYEYAEYVASRIVQNNWITNQEFGFSFARE